MKMNHARYGLAALLLAVMLGLGIFAAPAYAETPPAEAEEEIRVVDAATVDELLKAIASDTVINLTGRSYDLTEAKGYGVFGSRYYGWNEIYDDGWELEINGVENLTIRASGAGTEIVTVPRYACVLKLVNCRNVTLEGFTAGHTDGPGYCTGAVIHLGNCRDVCVNGCDLYGCGTYGLEIEKSRGVHAANTTIRDCSYGAVYASASSDILLDGCSVYGIEGFGGTFTYYSCHDCALINSMVRSCTADSLIELSSTRDFYMAGCEISRNSFQGMFASTGFPFAVEGCAFKNNAAVLGWYQEEWQRSERAVDPTGREYSDGELEALTLMKDVRWSAPAEREVLTQAPPVSEDGMIHVTNVDELLAAIGPNVSIMLEDGVYDLSQAGGYGTHSGEYYYWMSCFDGPGLVICNVENLSITAAGPHRARIVAVPRYCEVLEFEDCTGVSLSGFTAGHTQSLEGMTCAGGVLEFMNSRDIAVKDCSLYGCGVMGITCLNCRDISISFTEIYDCTYGAFYFYGSRDAAVSSCNIHDIPGPAFQVYDCQGVTADGYTVPEGESW